MSDDHRAAIDALMAKVDEVGKRSHQYRVAEADLADHAQHFGAKAAVLEAELALLHRSVALLRAATMKGKKEN